MYTAPMFAAKIITKVFSMSVHQQTKIPGTSEFNSSITMFLQISLPFSSVLNILRLNVLLISRINRTLGKRSDSNCQELILILIVQSVCLAGCNVFLPGQPGPRTTIVVYQGIFSLGILTGRVQKYQTLAVFTSQRPVIIG